MAWITGNSQNNGDRVFSLCKGLTGWEMRCAPPSPLLQQAITQGTKYNSPTLVRNFSLVRKNRGKFLIAACVSSDHHDGNSSNSVWRMCYFTCTWGDIHPGRVEPKSPSDVSWAVSTPKSPVPASLHLLTLLLFTSSLFVLIQVTQRGRKEKEFDRQMCAQYTTISWTIL